MEFKVILNKFNNIEFDKVRCTKVADNTIKVMSNNSFLRRQLYKLKISSALKFCDEIKEKVNAHHKIGRDDFYVNIVVANPENDEIEENYYAVKGYNKDGSLRPLQMYTIKNEKLIQADIVSSNGIIVVDLFERSIFLHNYSMNGDYAEGFIVNQDALKQGYNLILSAEKVSVFMKNANSYEEYKSAYEFVDKYLL